MRIHRQHGPSQTPTGRKDHTPDIPPRHLRWRLPRRGDRWNAHPAPGTDTAGAPAALVPSAPSEAADPPSAPSEAAVVPSAPSEAAAAMQMAIGLLTASLDSPELEAWAADALIPQDVDGLGDFMAGLHVVALVLLYELHEATGEPLASIVQRLAFTAERRRGTPSNG